MKTLFLLCLSLLLTSIPTNAQEGWFWQNPLPQGNNLNSIHFIDSNIGWAVGHTGTVLKTTNGGTDWVRLFN